MKCNCKKCGCVLGDEAFISGQYYICYDCWRKEDKKRGKVEKLQLAHDLAEGSEIIIRSEKRSN